MSFSSHSTVVMVEKHEFKMVHLVNGRVGLFLETDSNSFSFFRIPSGCEALQLFYKL